MKILKSLPQNAAFFERYAELITSLASVATIAQIITGACEIGIINALLYSPMKDILPPQYVGIVSMAGAIVCALMLQIGLKQVYPYSVRAFLYHRWKGLDLWFSMCVIFMTATLLTASVYLSFEGAKDIADIALTAPKPKTTDKSEAVKDEAIGTATRLFSSDSATIETKFSGKIEATTANYDNQIATVEKWAKGKKATTLRADKTARIASLKAEKAAEIDTKAQKRDAAIDRANGKADGEAAIILTDNATAKGEFETKRGKYKGYISYFTLVCYVFFIIVFTLSEIYKKGANIETKPIPSQRHFNPSVLAVFFETLKEKIDVFFRTKIQNWADKTPPQPLPNAESALYDFRADVLTDTVKIETETKTAKVIKLPLKMPKIAAQLKEADGEKTADGDKKGRRIGFFQPSKIAELDGEKETADEKKTADITAAVITAEKPQPKIRNCEWCNNRFEYVVYNKKFCSEDCRKASWTAKTGVEFNLDVKKKERLKK